MNRRLNILWTNADPVTARLMVFMYAENALLRGWWESVRIIVWGATARLVAEDRGIQEKLLDIKSKGVQVDVCISCARELGVDTVLGDLGLNVEPMGIPLTELIKADEKLITI